MSTGKWFWDDFCNTTIFFFSGTSDNIDLHDSGIIRKPKQIAYTTSYGSKLPLKGIPLIITLGQKTILLLMKFSLNSLRIVLSDN